MVHERAWKPPPVRKVTCAQVFILEKYTKYEYSGGCQHVTWALRFFKDSKLCRFPLGVSHLTWNTTCNVLTPGKSYMGESLVTLGTLAIDTRGTVSATGSWGRTSNWNWNKFMNMLIGFTTVEAQEDLREQSAVYLNACSKKVNLVIRSMATNEH